MKKYEILSFHFEDKEMCREWLKMGIPKSDNPSELDLARLKARLGKPWLCSHWLRNRIVTFRKAGNFKEGLEV